MERHIRVVLADDHSLVRAGVRALLRDLGEMEVVAEASDGREALRLIKLHQPDVALLDIAMSGLNGLEVAAQATKDTPSVRVIMLSMHANEEYVLQALRAGAVGYLLKDAVPAELELAVRSVARGETYLSPPVSRHLVTYMRRVGPATANGAGGEVPSDSLTQLTTRQREVLQLIAEGRTTKEIAALLHLSVKTIETHRTQLMARLNAHDVAALVRYAIRVGLISPDK